MPRSRAIAAAVATLWLAAVCSGAVRAARAEEFYRKPPRAVLDVLNAPTLPTVWLDPTKRTFLLGETLAYPPVADLAVPMLRLAGLRIDPATNGQHRASYWTGLTLRAVADGREHVIALPSGSRVGPPQWTADGTRFAFTNTTRDGIELWIGDVAAAAAHKVDGIRVNGLLGSGMAWMSDQRTLLVRTVPPGRGAPPPQPAVPSGPNIQEAAGKSGIGSTYEVRDVLKNPHDEALFDYYLTCAFVRVDAASGGTTALGGPDLYASMVPSPDGQYLLVERMHRPYSYLHPYSRFAKEIEIWDRSGAMVERLASLPLADQVPIRGVPTGPRATRWRPNSPATLVWAEALDGGNPATKVPHRDRLMTWSAPFESQPAEIGKLEHRFAGLVFAASGGRALCDEHEWERRWTRTYAIDVDAPDLARRLIWDHSDNERYADPGSPVLRVLPTGAWVVHQEGDWIYLAGAGASSDGDRPFLDRFNLTTFETERLFRSDRTSYESFIGWLDAPAGRFMTRRESPEDPPNYFVRSLGDRRSGRTVAGEAARASTARQITRFRDPTPQLRAVHKEIVTYERKDGVSLSFTLYLPPGYKKGTRLPTALWAYPLEYSDAGTAGQIAGSDRRFTLFGGASPLFLVLGGYAVLYNTAMPVVGHPDSVYDTFVDQITANASAAIDKAVALGVTDPERVGVTGHSHGALMTANLLAHTDLFRAGFARSGAYNHTLRPFGFQTERRTLYEARDVYVHLSPLMHADKINEPLLLMHGEIDANPGTLPMQSEMLYRAVAGTGGTARLVMLPHESHGYEARESIEHALYEQQAWFDRWVKAAAPRTATAAGGSN
jgi:dipeptidyl aminopeptidase/acylaminoacyl peptidase